MRPVVLPEIQSSHDFGKAPGILVISYQHTAFYSKRIIKEIFAAQFDCLVVVPLYKVLNAWVDWNSSILACRGFHPASDVLFIEIDISNFQYGKFLWAPSHVTLYKNPVHKAEGINIIP